MVDVIVLVIVLIGFFYIVVPLYSLWLMVIGVMLLTMVLYLIAKLAIRYLLWFILYDKSKR